MQGLFLVLVAIGVFGATENEACKADGITDYKACVERTWDNREALDYSKLND